MRKKISIRGIVLSVKGIGYSNTIRRLDTVTVLSVTVGT
jgi:hypothetical protein